MFRLFRVIFRLNLGGCVCICACMHTSGLLYWDGKGPEGLRPWKRDDDDDDDIDDSVDNSDEDNGYLNCQQERSGLVMISLAFEGIST